jgi:hypothetical protein
MSSHKFCASAAACGVPDPFHDTTTLEAVREIAIVASGL